MKRSTIRVGHQYRARVGGTLTTVLVDSVLVCEDWRGVVKRTYRVTNLATGRRTTFRDAQRFLEEVPLEAPAAGKQVVQYLLETVKP